MTARWGSSHSSASSARGNAVHTKPLPGFAARRLGRAHALPHVAPAHNDIGHPNGTQAPEPTSVAVHEALGGGVHGLDLPTLLHQHLLQRTRGGENTQAWGTADERSGARTRSGHPDALRTDAPVVLLGGVPGGFQMPLAMLQSKDTSLVGGQGPARQGCDERQASAIGGWL
jgi:hypothetical protein